MSADWTAIKAEYLNTQISTRKLAEKYGVSYPSLRDRAKREDWKCERSKNVANTLRKTADAVSGAHVDRITELMDGSRQAAALLIGRLGQMAEEGKIKTYEIKAITEAFKNIRDLYETDTTPEDGEDSDGLMDALNATASEVCSGEDDSFMLPGGGNDGEEESR